MDDAALATLLLPFEEGDLAWPEDLPVLFLRARAGAALTAGPLAARARATLRCRQSWRADFLALERAGFAVEAEEEGAPPAGGFPLVLLLAPRQRQEARALLARAAAAAAPGGTVAVALANLEGARSLESDFGALLGPVESRSKHKCRVFWAARREDRLDRALLDEWAEGDRPRAETESGLLTRPGLFAWDRVDAGSALLARHLPGDLAGRTADLGAGVGYLSVALLERCPGLSALDLYEAEKRALDLAERNLAGRGDAVALDFLWHDVTEGLPRTYDLIVSNPPFHRGREARSDLGQGFIAAASAALRPGGRFWLVANRHLPYEAALRAGFAGVRTVADEAGYKVIEAIGREPKSAAKGKRR